MIVPVEHGHALFDAAPEPKRLVVVPGVGHNDIVSRAGPRLAAEIASLSVESGSAPRARPRPKQRRR